MGKMIRYGWACALAIVSSAAGAQDQGKNIWEEYGKRVKSSATVSALGPDLFGDQVSLSNGALSFSVTDVSLPGNDALPVAFTRTFSIRGSNEPGIYNDFPMEDWEIDLPNISGVFAPNWISGNSATPFQRCSVTYAEAAAPPTVYVGDDLFQSKDYWQGHTLSLPGGGGEMLLLGADQPRPTTGGPYYWVTGDQTRISCLDTIKNWSGGGEGFMATTPDGTRYWFDWMAQYLEPLILTTKGIWKGGGEGFMEIPQQHPRRRNAIYPSRVEDRFGNSVVYTYENAHNAPVRLTQIKSSDGRQIDIAYDTTHGAVSKVTAGTREWLYRYTATNAVDHSLSTVIQPDQSEWNISFAGLASANVEYLKTAGGEPSFRTCTRHPPLLDPKVFIGSATHPSGATGEFTVEVVPHGRTNVPMLCEKFTSPNNIPNDDLSIHPLYHHGLSLAKKKISGPGLQSLEWIYSYNSPRSFFYPAGASATYPVCTNGVDCSLPQCVSDDCAGVSTTKVTDPKGDWVRHSYGNSYRYNEGKLVQLEVGTGASTVLRSTVNQYDLTQVDQVYPARWGTSPRMYKEGFASEYHRPELSRTIHQDEVIFSRVNNTFDRFAYPLSVTRSSTLGFSKSEITDYHEDLALWVLGQVKSVTDYGTGKIVSRTDYGWKALPWKTYSFEKLQQTFGYHPSVGTLATVADGIGNTTTLSDWYRGVPRLVTYADTTTQSAVVNPFGWITRVTDPYQSQTNYEHDEMGRTTKAIYPIGDTPAWNDTVAAFAQVDDAEYGIAPGHWRQTTSTGGGTRITYFDALWQPLLTHEYDAENKVATQRFQRSSFDHAGRAFFSSYASTVSNPVTGIWTEFDALGRQTSVSQDSEQDLLTTVTDYLPGMKTRTTNPRGHSTTVSYQAYDAPDTSMPVQIQAPEGVTTTIGRDAYGKPQALIRSGPEG